MAVRLLLLVALSLLASGANILLVTDCRTASTLETILSNDGHLVTTAYAAAGSVSGCYNVPVLQGPLPYQLIIWESNGPISGGGEGICPATGDALNTFVDCGGIVVIYGYDVLASPDDPVLINLLGGGSATDGSAGLGTPLSSTKEAEFVTTGVVDIRGVVGQQPTCSTDRDTLNAPFFGCVVPVWGSGSNYMWSITYRGSGIFVWMSTSCSGCDAYGDSYWLPVSAGSQDYVYNPAIRNIAFNSVNPRSPAPCSTRRL